MREEKVNQTIETTIYYSDDGAFSSRDKRKVKEYELKAKCSVNKVNTLNLIDNKGNNITYAVYKLKSKDDLNFLIKAYEDAFGKFILVVDDYIKREFPLSTKEYFAPEYFVVYYHTGLQRYKFEPINSLYQKIRHEIVEDAIKLSLEKSALTFLEGLKNE